MIWFIFLTWKFNRTLHSKVWTRIWPITLIYFLSKGVILVRENCFQKGSILFQVMVILNYQWNIFIFGIQLISAFRDKCFNIICKFLTHNSLIWFFSMCTFIKSINDIHIYIYWLFFPQRFPMKLDTYF